MKLFLCLCTQTCTKNKTKHVFLIVSLEIRPISQFPSFVLWSDGRNSWAKLGIKWISFTVCWTLWWEVIQQFPLYLLLGRSAGKVVTDRIKTQERKRFKINLGRKVATWTEKSINIYESSLEHVKVTTFRQQWCSWLAYRRWIISKISLLVCYLKQRFDIMILLLL